jgi:hypothetical protein
MGESTHVRDTAAFIRSLRRGRAAGTDTQIHPLRGGLPLARIWAMSLTLQNDFARRLRYGGPRQAIIASALFGRSCRLLDPPVPNRRKRVLGHRPEPGDRI